MSSIYRTEAAPSTKGASARRRAELPPEANGNVKWRDTTDALWMRSSLSKVESEAIVEAAKFDDGFRVVRDGKSLEKGTLFFSPAGWEFFVLGLGILRRMGADVQVEASTGSVRAASAPLRGVEITGADVPGSVDEIPVLPVAAAVARTSGQTTISCAAAVRDRTRGPRPVSHRGPAIEAIRRRRP